MELKKELKEYDKFVNDYFGDCNIAGVDYKASHVQKSVDPDVYYQHFFNWWLKQENE